MSAESPDELPLRRAVPADAEPVRNCVQAAYARWIAVLGYPPKPAERDYHATIQEQDVWVAERAGKIIAVLGLIDRQDDVMIDNIAVDPAHHGRGLGSRLLEFAETEAVRLGVPTIRLYTNAKMVKNIAWYRRHGYRVVERRRMQHKVVVFMEKPAA